jgi:hypothetical protein
MRTERADVQLHSFLNSAVYGGQWSAEGFGHFTTRKITVGTSFVRKVLRLSLKQYKIQPHN